MAGSSSVEVKEFSKIEEMHGSMGLKEIGEGLMRSVIENDKEVIDDGKLISDALNQGFSSFVPDMMFDNLVKQFSLAKQIYGERLIRLLTGYETGYLGRNIKIPEFQRQVKDNIEKGVEKLKNKGLLDKNSAISEKGMELAALALYKEEVDKLAPKGFEGEKIHKKTAAYGDKENTRSFRKGDRYRDIAVRGSVKRAIRRGHVSVEEQDLMVHERQSKGSIYIVYAIDASGSMKGDKIELAKKAGIALAYTAVEEKDKVGLLVFGKDVRSEVMPTSDFLTLLKEIAAVKAKEETDLRKTISHSIRMFPQGNVTKHLIILTDALPTVGDEPENAALEEASKAISAGITISVVGIGLDKKGRELAEKIATLGQGRLYSVRNLEKLDRIILEDYYSVV